MASNFIKEKFFVLDSNNYKDFKTKLYGYYFDEQGNLITQSNFEKFNENAHGAYIFVENNNGKITIKQDFNGSYGLYLFQKDNYFAVSNSFLYLVEYLKSKFELTYNYDYANTFIVCGLCSEVYEKTFINEITALSRDTEIHIYDNIIQLLNIDYKEYSISIDSKEWIDTLDKWFFKYTSIIRNIKAKSNLLSCDLSGGFDSRCCFALFLAANINLDEVKINSSTDGLHCHPEDLKIATDIANYFNFQLNKQPKLPTSHKFYPFKDIQTVIDLSFYTKLGFHKEMYFKTWIRNVIHYSFMGAEGEFLRGAPIITKQQYIGRYSLSKLFGKTYIESIDKVLQDTFFNLKNKFKIENENFIPTFCCREGQSKNHFGKSRVGNYISNVLSFYPLSDKIIRKINFNNQNCSDRKLLITVLLDRYCPDLLNFEVEGGRKFEPETIEYAKKINAKFPFTNPYTTKISLDKTKEDNTILELSSAEKNAIDEKSKISAADCNNYLKDIFLSDGFKNIFEAHFSKQTYSHILSTLNRNYFPLRHAYSAIAAIKFLLDVRQSKVNKKVNSSLDNFQELMNIPNKFDSELDLSEFNDNFKCRIDIKNVGTENCKVEIVGISGVTYPEWFKNKNGVGAVVSTYIGNKNLEIICKGNGWLYILLRGIDKRNNENKRIPMYICADELKINEHTIFNEPKIVWHDDSYLYKMPVTDGQKVKIFVKFSPAFYKK